MHLAETYKCNSSRITINLHTYLRILVSTIFFNSQMPIFQCFEFNVRSVSFICTAKFDRDQKAALMIPAKEAYGDVTKWNEKVLGSLCNILEELPVRDILNLAADVVRFKTLFKSLKSTDLCKVQSRSLSCIVSGCMHYNAYI